MATSTTASEREVIYLLVPPALKLLLQEKAKDNARSLNAECNVVLTRYVKADYRIL